MVYLTTVGPFPEAIFVLAAALVLASLGATSRIRTEAPHVWRGEAPASTSRRRVSAGTIVELQYTLIQNSQDILVRSLARTPRASLYTATPRQPLISNMPYCTSNLNTGWLGCDY